MYALGRSLSSNEAPQRGANFAYLLCVGPGGHLALARKAGTAEGGLQRRQLPKGRCAFPYTHSTPTQKC